MKALKFFSVAVLTLLGSAVFAQTKTESIKVSGECGMCKKNIETALKVPGINTASWNTKTKILKVSYDAAKISNDDIQKKVAAAGYDTPKYKATEADYKKLDDCCQYDRGGIEKLPAKTH